MLHVMVPVDGSRLAERAVDVALPLIQRCEGKLSLVKVRQSLGDASADADRKYLKQLADRADDFPGPIVSSHLMTDRLVGRPMPDPPRRVIADVLAEFAVSDNVDLAIMTTHGRGGLARTWMGSVADSFIRHAPVPVFVFRPDSRRTRIDRIVALHDGSVDAEFVLGSALQLAECAAAECTLLHVAADARDIDAACEMLVRVADDHSGQVRLSVDVITGEDVAASVLAYAVEHHVDVIALTTRTTNAAERLLLGSVADRLVRTADRPLLICNASLARRAATVRSDSAQ